MSRFPIFEANDLIAFLLVFVFDSCVLSSRGILELSFLLHHLLELSGHKSHFIIWESPELLFEPSNLAINTLRALEELFFSSRLDLVSPDLRAAKSFWQMISILNMNFMNS